DPHHVGLDRGVAYHRDRSAAVRLDERRRFLDQIARPRRADHRRAFGREHPAHRAPHTLAGARDERDSPRQLPHRPASRASIYMARRWCTWRAYGARECCPACRCRYWNARIISSRATIWPPRVDDATTMSVRTPVAIHASAPSRTSAALPNRVTSFSQRSDISSG